MYFLALHKKMCAYMSMANNSIFTSDSTGGWLSTGNLPWAIIPSKGKIEGYLEHIHGIALYYILSWLFYCAFILDILINKAFVIFRISSVAVFVCNWTCSY